MSLVLPMKTKRLVLRELRAEDWVDARALDGDPEVVRFQSNDVLDEAGTKANLARSIVSASESPRRVYDFAITRPGEDRYLGRAGFDVARPAHREAMVWFQLRRDLWGQGLVTEALTAVLDFAFFEVKVHRCFGDCDPRNVGSARVMEKVGMKREAHLRENWWLKGEWCDSWIFGVLEGEWRAARSGSP